MCKITLSKCFRRTYYGSHHPFSRPFGDLFRTSIFWWFWSIWIILAPFWLPFGSLLAPFWLPLAPFWLPLAPFWLPLAQLLAGTLRAPFLTFGSLLASFLHFSWSQIYLYFRSNFWQTHSVFWLQFCIRNNDILAPIFEENMFFRQTYPQKIGDCRTQPQPKGNLPKASSTVRASQGPERNLAAGNLDPLRARRRPRRV